MPESLKRIGPPLHRATRRSRLAVERTAHRAAIAARARAAGPDARREPVFVLGTPRTGTFLATEYLDSLPGATFAGEILSAGHPAGLGRRGLTRTTVERHLLHSIGALSGRPKGAKLIFQQLDQVGIDLDDVHRLFPDLRLVIVYRASMAHQFVSHMVARRTRQWYSAAGERYDGTVVIDPDEFRRWSSRTRAIYDDALGRPWVAERSVVVSYEQLSDDAQAVFADVVCPFLGVAASPVRTSTQKQNVRPLSELVENWADVADVLTGPEGRLDCGGGRRAAGP